MQPIKVAADVAVGDVIEVTASNKTVRATVLSIEPSVKMTRRQVLIFTVQSEGQLPTHRTFNVNSPVRIHKAV